MCIRDRDYLRRCEILRKHFKRPAITTDVIVGFPGETKEEFDITEKYLEKVHFYEMHVFKYSRRAGTKAAAMTDQIPEQEKGDVYKRQRYELLCTVRKRGNNCDSLSDRLPVGISGRSCRFHCRRRGTYFSPWISDRRGSGPSGSWNQ